MHDLESSERGHIRNGFVIGSGSLLAPICVSKDYQDHRNPRFSGTYETNSSRSGLSIRKACSEFSVWLLTDLDTSMKSLVTVYRFINSVSS
jgi:hypothetical protein